MKRFWGLLLACFPLFAAEEPRYSFNGAVLYWWTQAPGLAYAVKGSVNPDTTATKGKILNPPEKPEVGFELGFRGILPKRGWDLYLQATHLHSRASFDKYSSGSTLLFPLLISSNSQGFVDSVKGHWRLHFVMFDLELGKKIETSSCLDIRPHIGLKYARIRQKYRLRYSGGSLFPGGRDRVYMTNKYLSPGLRMGLDADWRIKWGLSIFSEMAFSILYGNALIHQEEHITSKPKSRIMRKFPLGAPVIDLNLGVKWDRDRYGVYLAWEEHLFFSMNNTFTLVQPNFQTLQSSRESLSLGGLTFGGRYSF